MPQSEESNEIFWFPTPQKPGDESEHTPLQKRTLQELIALKTLKKVNPQDNQELRDHFLSLFNWTGSTLDKQARQSIEGLLVQIQDIFARH